MIPLLKHLLPLLKAQIPYLLMFRAYVSGLVTLQEYTIANEDGIITARERRRIVLAAVLTEIRLPGVVARGLRWCRRGFGFSEKEQRLRRRGRV